MDKLRRNHCYWIIENKKMIRITFLILLSLCFLIGSCILFYNMFLSPLLSDTVVIFGASFSFMMLSSLNIVSRLYFSKELKIQTFIIISVLLGFIGMGLNITIFNQVINPNGLIECPNKIGYKKNLLKDYVVDIRQCEKI